MKKKCCESCVYFREDGVALNLAVYFITWRCVFRPDGSPHRGLLLFRVPCTGGYMKKCKCGRYWDDHCGISWRIKAN